MTTYNTGNPVPSADARDRYDNSQTLDEVVNGDSASYTTRTGKQVISLGGMNSRFNNAQDEREVEFNLSQEEKQEEFQSFLEGTGWSSLGAYATGVVITSHTQTVEYLGQPYSLKSTVPASFDTPYVVVGDWATESVNFKLVGDNSIRQDLRSAAGASFVWTKAPLALAVERPVSDKLGEHISLLDLVPPGTDLWNTDLTPWVQYGVTAYGVLELPKGNLRINGPVYVRSDREIPGMGCTFGGTVVRSSTPGPVFIGGAAGAPTHTRVSITGIKFVCDNLTDRTKFTLSFLSGFMNEFHNLSFGDISGVGNQQNGLDISGTAHWVGNIRGISLAEEVGLEASTGILLRSTRGTNSYSNIQSETNAKIVMDGERNSRFFGTHSERCKLQFKGCGWILHAGAYFIDGTHSKDERSAGNTTLNLGGANARMSDLGMFNDYFNCATSLGSHGALRYGLGDSYLKESVIATAWNSVTHKAYKLPTAGWYIAVVLCKNTFENGTLAGVQAGTVQAYNLTTAVVLASQAYSITNNSGIVGSQANSGNATQTVILCFKGALNDNIVIREPTEPRSRSGIVKVFMSPVENVNPMMTEGGGWVTGSPAIPGESYFPQAVGVTPTVSGGKLLMPLSGSGVFSVTQNFRPRTAAEIYGVIVKGTWTSGALRVTPGTGNDGTRGNVVSQNLDALGEDGFRYLIQYIDGRALSTAEGVTRISVGSTLPPPAQTMELSMIAVFPVR